MKAKIINKSNNQMPEYATPQSAGVDLRANLEDKVTIYPMQRIMIPTGLHIQLPVGYEAQVRPRSGLAIKHGITVLNAPGTVDSDYRGEICVILINLGDAPFVVSHGDRIAQMVIAKHEQIEFEATDSLDDTERGENGFGHSGNK